MGPNFLIVIIQS